MSGAVLPVEVVAAIESAAEVRRRLEQVDLDEPGERSWARYEVALLEHWAAQLREGLDYPALGEGLAGFARRCADTLAASEREPG